MAGKSGGSKPAKGSNDNRPKGKAWKKTIKVFDPAKGRLVRRPHPQA